jgi:hypothetical protein
MSFLKRMVGERKEKAPGTCASLYLDDKIDNLA